LNASKLPLFKGIGLTESPLQGKVSGI